MGGIFLSYRRDDAAGHAGRFYDRLSDQFGQTTFTATTDGQLYLGANDKGVDNNSGAFSATVEVLGAA